MHFTTAAHRLLACRCPSLLLACRCPTTTAACPRWSPCSAVDRWLPLSPGFAIRPSSTPTAAARWLMLSTPITPTSPLLTPVAPYFPTCDARHCCSLTDAHLSLLTHHRPPAVVRLLPTTIPTRPLQMHDIVSTIEERHTTFCLARMAIHVGVSLNSYILGVMLNFLCVVL
jgi:hypothetical protein